MGIDQRGMPSTQGAFRLGSADSCVLAQSTEGKETYLTEPEGVSHF